MVDRWASYNLVFRMLNFDSLTFFFEDLETLIIVTYIFSDQASRQVNNFCDLLSTNSYDSEIKTSRQTANIWHVRHWFRRVKNVVKLFAYPNVAFYVKFCAAYPFFDPYILKLHVILINIALMRCPHGHLTPEWFFNLGYSCDFLHFKLFIIINRIN